MAEESVEQLMLRALADRLDPISAGGDDDQTLIDARATFEGFVRFVMPEYQVNWHHKIFFDAIQRWIDRKTTRLMIFCPPQGGKSLLVSRLLPAYLFGLNPDEAIIASSFNAEYASKNNVDVQRIIDSERYRQVFPMTRIAGDGKGDAGWKRNARMFEIVGRKGTYFCGGVRTGTSGRPMHCFPAGVMVETEFGRMDIADIVSSNQSVKVWSFCHTSNRMELKRVVARQTFPSCEFVRITASDGSRILSTPNHRIYDCKSGYREAESFRPGDRIAILGAKTDLPDLRSREVGREQDVPRLLHGVPGRENDRALHGLRQRHTDRQRGGRQIDPQGVEGEVLLVGMPPFHAQEDVDEDVRAVRRAVAHEAGQILHALPEGEVEGEAEETAGREVRGMLEGFREGEFPPRLLLEGVRQRGPLQEDDRGGELPLQNRHELRETLHADGRVDPSTRPEPLRGLFDAGQAVLHQEGVQEWQEATEVEPRRSPPRREYAEQPAGKPDPNVRRLPHPAPRQDSPLREVAVSGVERIRLESQPVYDIQVEGNSNFFADGVLVHNSAVIDDMYKDDKDANSPAIQEAVLNWYITVFLARKSVAGARIIIVNTRWTMKDLCGTLLDFAKNDPKADQWDVVSVPALLESESQRYPGDPRQIGDALWPSRQSREELEATRAITPSAKWSCVYQQDPTPDKGVYFSRENFRYFWGEMDAKGQVWVVLDDGNGDEPRRFPASECLWFQTVDAADSLNKRNDFTAMTTEFRTPEADLCFWHARRSKVEFSRRYRSIIDSRYADPSGRPWPKPIDFQAMEEKASGISMIQLAASEGTPFRRLKPGLASKEQRTGEIVTLYENHKVFHHRGQPWLTQFEKELIEFPGGRNDDYVDCVSYAGKICVLQSSAGSTVSGELITSFEPPRNPDGSISLARTSLDPNYRGDQFRIGNYLVELGDDEGW
jgi:predicted phage terminase large subunit-like protein